MLCLVNDEALFAGLEAHLALVLGPHRLVALRGASSMASGCNALAASSPGAPDDILCFIHQDARLRFDAAAIVPRYFAGLPEAGVLGFCGSNAQQPGRQWHACPPCYGELRQGRESPIAVQFRPAECGESPLRHAEVQTLDGYCLFVRRDVFEQVGGFDEGYDGWHGYDVDLCLRALADGYRNYVIAQPSQHFSWGSRGAELDRALERFSRTWSSWIAAHPSSEAPRPPLQIHVYAIAKNEEAFAARFAASCAGADGIHVLDTGSTDRTVEVLRKHGVHVDVGVIDPWRFDLARNRSLELIPDDADVCLSIDLDEVLVRGWRRIVEDAWVPGTNHLDYQYVWEMRGGKPYRSFHYNKCHSRRGYAWVTPVHEVITPVAGFKEVFASTAQVLVEHYPDAAKSRGQYLALLELAVREDANDARSRFYLGREYTYASRWQDAIDTLRNYLERQSQSWSFERASACLMIARSHEMLQAAGSVAGDAGAAQRHAADTLRWLLRACSEEAGQREPWIALADHLRLAGDHAGSYWAAQRALALDQSARSYLNDPEAWGAKPHDLCSIAAWYLGLHDESLREALVALELAPYDGRLLENYLIVQELHAKAQAVASPSPAAEPLVDVVILSYACSAREYDMTKSCIESLRYSSPEVKLNIIVVETNTALRDEAFASKDAELFAPGVTVLQPGGRFGYNAYLQAGFHACAESPARHFMVLNNDVVMFANGFLRDMLAGLATVPSVSPLGLREALHGGIDRAAAVDLNYDINRAVCGWCLLFDKAILATVPFEQLFPMERTWYGQDETYAAMLQQHGIAHGQVTAARALHLQASSHYLLGRTLAAPADRRDMLTSLGIRHKHVAVVAPAGDAVAAEFAALDPAHLHHSTTHAAAAEVGAGSLDFVYFEAGLAAAAGLRTWWEAVRPGGWLTGGGYAEPRVARTVDAFCAGIGVPLAFVTRGADATWAIQVPARSP